jgi:hypothetical protein
VTQAVSDNFPGRQHPDLFNAEEALLFLHRDPADRSILEHLRGRGLLSGVRIGKELVYHRIELEHAVAALFAELIAAQAIAEQAERQKQPPTGPRLKLAGGGK